MSITLPQLSASIVFPPSEQALKHPDGLLAWGGDLSTERLLAAYQRGIFPWCSANEPLLWWTPSARMVLQFQHLHISHSLKKQLRKIQRNPLGSRQVRIDTAFTDVMRACAGKRQHQEGTWIAEDFIQAYTQLHNQGYAHSVELWEDEQLIGGLYGVSIGKMFYGESMFSHQTDASKITLVFLMYYLALQGVYLVDCQQETPHLTSMGGACIPRQSFEQHLQLVCPQAPIQWQKGFVCPDILDSTTPIAALA
ncbi:leucyl/phenylalanyl-tRNA--protein transferase [Pelistega europaea]|uniref:Leucyl/phenylalanyl-tRNA--protein transferase n=1 Tax=Pelistega europaea TaxID=106147 RepID=A0A7Y4P551_9BURK|nr:leucyl/phenylalanyl-tRNA--protein transferase [Pelistega europaea]NOL50176.1 leucyl/phenylalanyl-tRNA--protein transferase [Pelistega europaea]